MELDAKRRGRFGVENVLRLLNSLIHRYPAVRRQEQNKLNYRLTPFSAFTIIS